MSLHYPTRVYASVLMLNGRVVDWCIGHTYWKDKYGVTYRGQVDMDDFDKLETKYTCWYVNYDYELNGVFNYYVRI